MAVSSAYLRKQARTCIRLANQCRGDPMSEKLLDLAGELQSKALELEALEALGAGTSCPRT